ncbi:para-aminobenzoate synthetase component 1 [Halopseudomonas sabulinigri]|uniref:aminodeoxychorismate synthase n=1 Tax=Halopseudomonas sabulinigri TaxID=472181 RepID=A0A1H1NKU9_9GAMM|nr:aminodeoxychorismate synthase component I [Halopseudomonas sabulinigri]SDR98939.1 para-aminobenzoate synthetase component 1 [Halopseudomonas sabulinigri]
MPEYQLTEVSYQADPLPRLISLRGLGHPVLLDSADNRSHLGRYSVLAAAPSTVVSSRNTPDALSEVRARLQVLGPARWPAGQALPFGAGALGYLSYDLARELENLPSLAADDIALPCIQLGIYRWSLVSDHLQQRCWLVCHPSLPEAERDKVLARLQQAPSEPAEFQLDAPFHAEQSKAQYAQAFARIQHYIQAGDCYQINLAQRFSSRYAGDPLEAYRLLRSASPTPFSAYLETPDACLLSLSPERFLQVHDAQVEARPIKGTRARGKTLAEDQALASELQHCLKDRAENLMIVDLLRNDLGRSCVPGSIRVPELFSLESYPNVHHLVSSVTGTLRTDCDAIELLRSSFPGGSITGAPKIRAMQIIEELEPVRRSLYCGGVGYIGCEGQMDFNIAIRSLVCANQQVYCWGGGGIVADSDIDAEYQETLTKVGNLLNALPIKPDY